MLGLNALENELPTDCLVFEARPGSWTLSVSSDNWLKGFLFWHEQLLAHLCIFFDETFAQVPEDRRINRATEAVFQFSSGAIGSLSHNLLLHDNKYHTAIEIVGDGVHIMLDDPYGAGKVLFRRPHSSVYEQVIILVWFGSNHILRKPGDTVSTCWHYCFKEHHIQTSVTNGLDQFAIFDEARHQTQLYLPGFLCSGSSTRDRHVHDSGWEIHYGN